MAYSLDPSKNPQRHLPEERLVRADEGTLRRLAQLNVDAANDLWQELLYDKHGPGLAQVVHAAVSSKKRRKRSITWEIQVNADMLQTRSHLFRLSKTEGQENVTVDAPKAKPAPACALCYGLGYKPTIHLGNRVLPSSAVGLSRVKLMVPKAILVSCSSVSKRLDELRRQGVFDDLLKYIERQLVKMKRSVYHYRIRIDSRITLQQRVSLLAPLADIRLSPNVGRKFPGRLTYFQACIACLGLGTRQR